MERILDSFFIEEPAFGPGPTEADRAQIARARRWTVWWGNWTLLCGFSLVFCLFMETYGAIQHVTAWWVPLVGFIRRIFNLFGCGLLLMDLLGRWLDANREAGLTVVYPPTLAQEVADLLAADRRPLIYSIGMRALVIGAALAVFQLIFG